MKLIAHFQRFWHQVSLTSHNLQDTQPIALGYSYLIKLYSLYKQGKNLAVMGTFSLVMRGLKESMSEMQSKYWLPLLIRALLCPFWWCHNLNFDQSKFRLFPAVCPSDIGWLCSVRNMHFASKDVMCNSKEMCAETCHCNFVAGHSVYTLETITSMVLLYGEPVCALQTQILLFKLFLEKQQAYFESGVIWV